VPLRSTTTFSVGHTRRYTNACGATKKETVTEALEEYIRRRKQARTTELFGSIDFEPAYNHKKQRRRK